MMLQVDTPMLQRKGPLLSVTQSSCIAASHSSHKAVKDCRYACKYRFSSYDTCWISTQGLHSFTKMPDVHSPWLAAVEMPHHALPRKTRLRSAYNACPAVPAKKAQDNGIYSWQDTAQLPCRAVESCFLEHRS